ncbi:MAG: YgiQ family radical SAM protein [Bacillota bacterium]
MLENKFLPTTKKEKEKLNWDKLDFILISADAYVDHPSFGHAIISRVLVNAGFKVGIIDQPDWTNQKDFKRLGKPKYGFIISAGNLDSMVNIYTVNKIPRKKDNYSPGGKNNKRPKRPSIVYSNMIKNVFPNSNIIIGGIGPSLRRFAHYDYWSDKVRHSILFDSGADLLIYGMGEKPILEIANNLKNGLDIEYINHIPGTCYAKSSLDNISDFVKLPSFKKVSNSKKEYAKAFKLYMDNQDPIRGKVLVQKHLKRYIIQNPPQMVLNQDELDWIYGLPYQRNYHPKYEKYGGIPALNEVKFSITSERGCYGNCSYCSLTFHQGRIVQSRSHKSIIKEAKKIIKSKDFKGYIHDVGGPTANFRKPACQKQLKDGVCKDKECLYPNVCSQIDVDHSDYLKLLKKLRNLEKVKKVFIRSGIRYDYLMADDSDEFFYELCENHVSGQLKVAPEHISEKVLYYMNKPSGKLYDKFSEKFYKINKEINKEQYLIPYLISSHPGSTLKDALELAIYLNNKNLQPEQVQDFYPTPGTLSTCMYYTEIDPRKMEKVFVAKSLSEKKMQRALLQFRYKNNYELVYKALVRLKRKDLIGFSKKALIPPKKNG